MVNITFNYLVIFLKRILGEKNSKIVCLMTKDLLERKKKKKKKKEPWKIQNGVLSGDLSKIPFNMWSCDNYVIVWMKKLTDGWAWDILKV